jgi:hypothetical protein
MIKKITVNSSCIDSIAYCDECESLAISFVQGKDYVYSRIHPILFDEFLKAKSKGKFYHDNIKGVYNSTLLEELDEIANIDDFVELHTDADDAESLVEEKTDTKKKQDNTYIIFFPIDGSAEIIEKEDIVDAIEEYNVNGNEFVIFKVGNIIFDSTI